MELSPPMLDLHTLSFEDVRPGTDALPTPPPETDRRLGADSDEVQGPAVRFERRMGDSELSYYLPSREDGVNDMYLHLGMSSASRFFTSVRVEVVWALLRLRHPLLASAVEMEAGDYHSARFVYTPPSSVEHALLDARATLTWRQSSKEDAINDYLNGPRTLSDRCLSRLIISAPGRISNHIPPSPPATPVHSSSETDSDSALSATGGELDLLITAAHFIGDGMALHMFANDLFQLIAGGGDSGYRSDQELLELLHVEWEKRWGDVTAHATFSLPSALEEGISLTTTRLEDAVQRVDFLRNQQKFIGAQAFPRPQSKKPRHTFVSTVSFDADTTKRILKKCKSQGVSISSALFAVCNIAAARTQVYDEKLPMLAYSAMNLRPQLRVQSESYWFLAVGYFNVVLPSFIPRALPIDRVFWHRARSAKAQSAPVAAPLLQRRAIQMAKERGRRSRRWASGDDGIEADPADADVRLVTGAENAPSRALVGLSLLGNLDGMYKHAAFAPLKLHTLTTGSRQRSGGMLIFGYTFAGKLWLSLGWDINGFDQPSVEGFWNEFQSCTKEFLDSN